ncbi:MAG: S8 family serine peptidase [Sulfurimonas sp.]
MKQINSTLNHKILALVILTGSTMLIGADTLKLQQMADEFTQKELMQKNEALEFAKQNDMPIRKELADGTVMEIQKIENGIPFYYITENADAATTTRSELLWNTPFSVTGSGYTKLGEWDGGAVRASHDELTGRVTQEDGATTISDHSTHVAGTLIASGAEPQAKGMAHQASLKAYDWNGDSSEMATAAGSGMEVSNHSYGYITGWYYNGSWHWYGDTSIDQNESYGFGFYNSTAQDWDTIAYNAPNYLIVKSAGNDRNDNAPAAGTVHTHNGFGSYTDTHHDDGYDNGGFDTISWHGVAKNILTVGSVNDISSYSGPSDVVMSSFSGWGPTDDGRIKPDITGNGAGLYSSLGSGDSAYGIYSGTSMSSPNVTGSLALLQQYYQSTHNSTPMRSATLKALVLHTADEAGSDTGPDYKFGWGLLNAQRAAEKIQEDINRSIVIDELSLINGGSYTNNIILTETGTEPLKVTIAWTDPAGTPVPPALDPPDRMLVNDLDLRIVKDGTTIYYPWKLDKNNPDNAATNDSENDIDNVEQIYIETPTAGTYQIVVDHDGTLAAAQAFSIVLSGVPNQAPTANAGPDRSVTVNETITITGSGTDTDGTIASYEWKEGTTVLATTASFDYTPTSVGDHTLTLTVTDNDGATDSDTMVVDVTNGAIIGGSGGGGGGCTYNPDSRSVDLMFIVMLMMSLFYPLRRRYLR